MLFGNISVVIFLTLFSIIFYLAIGKYYWTEQLREYILNAVLSYKYLVLIIWICKRSINCKTIPIA